MLLWESRLTIFYSVNFQDLNVEPIKNDYLYLRFGRKLKCINAQLCKMLCFRQISSSQGINLKDALQWKMEKKQEIGLRLREYRKDSGKTQGKFGESLGLTQGGYSDLERGKNNLTARIKYMLEEIYNINIDYLETGQGERYRIRETEELSSEDDTEKFYRDQNQRIIFQLQKELELTKKENEYLHKIISTKDEVISALKSGKLKGEDEPES